MGRVASGKPNILWILTTQWRGRATGFAGDGNSRTPCLDRLAGSGVWFRNAFTRHPFGPFARAAILTGVPSPDNGVCDYWDPLPAGTRTIASSMAEVGYSTAWFGKWHLSKRDPTAALVGEAHARQIVPATERGGFAFWEGFESGFLLNDPWLHGTRHPVPVRFTGYQSDVLANRASEWLAGQSRESPWFCVVSMESPHPPYDAASPITGVCAAGNIALDASVPLGGGAEARARRELSGYYDHIASTDDAIGRIVSSVPEDTIIVVTSVHGDMHGAHGLFRKGWPYDESVGVPLVVRGGGFESENSSNIVSLLDLPAMTLSWARGLVWKTEFPGFARISMPSVVELPFQCDRAWRGVRTRDWSMALNPDGSPWLLFNMNDDPAQLRNLVGSPGAEKIAAELARIA